MFAIFVLFNDEELDVPFSPALIMRDAQRVLDEKGIMLEDVYEIEIVRPFE